MHELHVEVYHEDVYIHYKQDHQVLVLFVEKDHKQVTKRKDKKKRRLNKIFTLSRSTINCSI